MKSIFKYTIKKFLPGIFLVTLFLLMGCEESLREEPKTFLSKDAVFESEQGAIAATTGIYETWDDGELFGWWLMGMPILTADYIHGRGSQAPPSYYQFDDNNIRRIGQIWEGCYEIINETNVIIKQLQDKDIEDLSADLKNRLIGEARFNRALSYFYLVRLFGDVPLRLEPETQNFNIPRTPKNEVYSQIIEDLEYGENNLPSSYSESNLGRATKWAATSVLSKVYLTRKNWDQAASKAQEVMNSGEFHLVKVEEPEDFQKMFGPTVNTHPEDIFSLIHVREPGLGHPAMWLMHINSPGNYTAGTGGAYAWLGNMESFLGDWVQPIEDIPENPDLRVRDWMYHGADTVVLSEELPMLFKKFRDTESPDHGNDTPIMRYTEVVLIYAEATAMANGAPTSESYEWINKVRRRAHGEPLDEPSQWDIETGLSAEEFQEKLLLERGKEFIMESKRWYDLIRTGTAIETIRAAGDENIKERHLLWPIPAREIDNNDAISYDDQNPGW